MSGPRTERLVLRPWEAGDLDLLLDLQARPEVVRWLYTGAMTREEAEADLARRRGQTGPDEFAYVGVLAATGERVGHFSVWRTSREHRQGELGFILHPDHRGAGYATEGARALLPVAFDVLELHRLTGRLEPRNVASGRVLERLGMRHEAHLAENEWVKGEWQSEVVYALLEREWRAGAGGG